MSNKNKKDKRTKDETLRLLDKALTQEERLTEKIKALETDLADCRKKAEDPRHELTDEAMPASKVSFRIDYYRTSDNSPLKGIIEHLPSRHNKPFEGEGQLAINRFMNRYLNEEKEKSDTEKSSVEESTKSRQGTTSREQKEATDKQETAPQVSYNINTGAELIARLQAEFAAAQHQKAAATSQKQQAQRSKPQTA